MKQALLVIDVQNEYFTGRLKVTYPDCGLDNVLKAMDHAKQQGILVVIIQHTAAAPNSPVFRKPTPEWELCPQIARRPYDVLIEKNLPGSFTGTSLEPVLRENAVDTVTICGFMTHMCCDTTARQACHLGFGVKFLSDATGTLDLKNDAGSLSAHDLHHAVLTVQQSRFSRVMRTDEWMGGL